jgi:8-oxo-dGTP diphosphatase
VADRIRISVKAIVMVGGRILLAKHRDSQGVWYCLPGGGQEHGETVEAALVRECAEETGLRVVPGPLVFVRDYIAEHHEFADEDPSVHQVELMFHCELAESDREPSVQVADPMQIGVEWVELSDLGKYRLYPKVMAGLLASDLPEGGAVYLGDVN